MLRIVFLILISFKAYAFYPIESYPSQSCSSITQQQIEFDGIQPRSDSIREGEMVYLVERVIFSYETRVFYTCQDELALSYSFYVKFRTYEEAQSTYEEWLELNINKFGTPNKSIEESWPIKSWNLDEGVLLGVSFDDFNESWSVTWSWHR